MRRANEGEKLTTLDGKEHDLSVEDLLITDSPNGERGSRILGLAGVMGGVQRFCVLAIFPLLLLGNERGKWKMKHFFYIYYPAHLALIGAMRMALEAVAG